MKTACKLMVILLTILALPFVARAADNQWSGGGPFATGQGNRVITALAVSPDGKTVYAGTGSGTILGYVFTPPTITGEAVTGIGISTATLNGAVNANNAESAISFEYGLTTAYGTSVTATPASIPGSTPVAVTASLTGLTTGTIYHYRIKATNSAGTSYSADQSFSTWLTPVFSSTADTTFTYNTAGSFTVGANGIPAPTFSTGSALPNGVTLNSNGTLSGTPLESGSFPLTITASNSAGTAQQNFTLTVNKAAATVTLGTLAQSYSGTARAATATTNPIGKTVTFTYTGTSGTVYATNSTPPVNMGSYTVVGTINDSNYQGTASGTLVVTKATATISLSNLTQAWDGTAKSATVNTTPSGLSVNITYNGSATAPSAIGSYPVVATITDSNYLGTANGTLVINDQGKPGITGFTATARPNYLIADTVITATDNVTPTGYCVTEQNNSTACAWTATSSASYTFATAGAKQLYAYAKDAAGNISDPYGPVAVSVSIPTLTVHNSVETGTLTSGIGGSITSSPVGITCNNNIKGTIKDCPGSFSGTVTLYATPSILSTFAGWTLTGTGTLTGCSGLGTCNVTMDGAKSVTATFRQATLLHSGGTSYPTLQEAYNSAGDGTVIEMAQSNDAGTLTADRAISVKLLGGYDAATYNSVTGMTTISTAGTKPLIIKSGKVVLDRIIVK